MRNKTDFRKPPFSLDRSRRGDLAEQIATGLRRAIATGYYKAGSLLPPVRDLSLMLEVSKGIAELALSRIREEGLISPRPRVGSVVCERGEKLWRGNVLFITRTDGREYYSSVFIATLRALLVRSGWLVTQVTAAPDDDGKTSVSELKIHINGCVSLAVVIFGNPIAEHLLSRSGIPFVTLDNRESNPMKECVGHVRYDSTEAAGRLAKTAIRAGAKTVMQVGFGSFDDVYAALEANGMIVSRWNIRLPNGGKSPESGAFAARRAFATRLSKSRAWFPDLIYFSDDYACVGALAAFSEAGVKVPDDIRVATWANIGNRPVFAKELARTEMDPESDAARLATALLAHLEGCPIAFPLTFGPTFRKGATL